MKKPAQERSGEVPSPCIKKCSLDKNNICPACFRSIEEIAAWGDADDDRRREIVEAARRRRSRSGQ